MWRHYCSSKAPFFEFPSLDFLVSEGISPPCQPFLEQAIATLPWSVHWGLFEGVSDAWLLPAPRQERSSSASSPTFKLRINHLVVSPSLSSSLSFSFLTSAFFFGLGEKEWQERRPKGPFRECVRPRSLFLLTVLSTVGVLTLCPMPVYTRENSRPVELRTK